MLAVNHNYVFIIIIRTASSTELGKNQIKLVKEENQTNIPKTVHSTVRAMQGVV